MTGIKQVGEKEGTIGAELLVIADPLRPKGFAGDHLLRFESRVDRFKNSGQRIDHRQIGRAARHRDVQRDQDAIAHAQIFRRTQFAVVSQFRVPACDRVTAILPRLLDQFRPRLRCRLRVNLAARLAQVNRFGAPLSFDGEGRGRERLCLAQRKRRRRFVPAHFARRIAIARLDLAQIRRKREDRPGVCLRRAPVSVAAPRKQFRRQFIHARRRRLMEGPCHQVQRVFPRHGTEELLNVAIVAFRHAEQFVDHRLRSLAFDHRQRDERAIFGAQFGALLEQQIVVGRLRLARNRQRVDGKTAIRESITGCILRRAAKLFAQITKQLLCFRNGHRKFLPLREGQRESAISASPQHRFASARPVAKATGAGLH